MKKYRVFVRGENFLMRIEEQDQKLGFYTTVFVEALNEESAELKATELLWNDQRLIGSMLNTESDSPMIFVEEIEELESFDGLNLPRTGFAFYPDEK